jgi:hypothetical protein
MHNAQCTMQNVDCEQRRENWFGDSRRLISARSGTIATTAGLGATTSTICWCSLNRNVHCALCIVHFAL